MLNDKNINYVCPQCGVTVVPRYLPAKRCPHCFVTLDKKLDKGKYHFDQIEVGQYKMYGWVMTRQGTPNELENYKIHRALRMYSKRTGKLFRCISFCSGLKIVRIK